MPGRGFHQSVEMPSSCTVNFRFPTFVSCHSRWDEVLVICLLFLSLIQAPMSNSYKTYWLIKLDFGGVLILVCHWFTVWGEWSFVHTFPGIGEQKKSRHRKAGPSQALSLCQLDHYQKQHRGLFVFRPVPLISHYLLNHSTRVNLSWGPSKSGLKPRWELAWLSRASQTTKEAHNKTGWKLSKAQRRVMLADIVDDIKSLFK